MQRRIKARPPDTAAYQALIDHKQATLNVLLSRIPDVSTFAQTCVGWSSDKQGNNRDEFVAVVGLNVWNVV